MAVKDIVLYAEQEAILRRKSKAVKHVKGARGIIQDLKDTLLDHPDGVGLAAPQIGIHRRVIIVRLGGRSDGEQEPGPPQALVNPKIIEAGDKEKDFDGCLSFPGLYGETVRPHYLRVSALDEKGQPFERTFEGFDAVIVHHEIDHLDGVLFIDRVERIEDLYQVRVGEEGNLVRVPLEMPTTRPTDGFGAGPTLKAQLWDEREAKQK